MLNIRICEGRYERTYSIACLSRFAIICFSVSLRALAGLGLSFALRNFRLRGSEGPAAAMVTDQDRKRRGDVDEGKGKQVIKTFDRKVQWRRLSHATTSLILSSSLMFSTRLTMINGACAGHHRPPSHRYPVRRS